MSLYQIIKSVNNTNNSAIFYDLMSKPNYDSYMELILLEKLPAPK